MSENKKLLICVVRNDITNLFLLYRKLAETSFDAIGLFVTHIGQKQRGLLNQRVTKLFPKIAFLGPTLMYDHLITMANFHHRIDLENYAGNMVNIDIVHHLKNYRLDEIFPKQNTVGTHELNVVPTEFQMGVDMTDSKRFCLGINLIDQIYDGNANLIQELPLVLDALEQSIPQDKINIYLFGMVPTTIAVQYVEALQEYIPKYQTFDMTPLEYSQQIGVLCNLDLLLSGSYTWGYLSYISKTPTIMIYPFYLSDMKGKILPLDHTNPLYTELIDDELPLLIDEVMEPYIDNWNRNRNL